MGNFLPKEMYLLGSCSAIIKYLLGSRGQIFARVRYLSGSNICQDHVSLRFMYLSSHVSASGKYFVRVKYLPGSGICQGQISVRVCQDKCICQGHVSAKVKYSIRIKYMPVSSILPESSICQGQVSGMQGRVSARVKYLPESDSSSKY